MLHLGVIVFWKHLKKPRRCHCQNKVWEMSKVKKNRHPAQSCSIVFLRFNVVFIFFADFPRLLLDRHFFFCWNRKFHPKINKNDTNSREFFFKYIDVSELNVTATDHMLINRTLRLNAKWKKKDYILQSLSATYLQFLFEAAFSSIKDRSERPDWIQWSVPINQSFFF